MVYEKLCQSIFCLWVIKENFAMWPIPPLLSIKTAEWGPHKY